MSLILNEFLPWQLECYKWAINQKADIIGASGGFGSGKTSLLSNITRDVMKRNGKRMIAVANSFPTIKDIFTPSIEEEIPPEYIINSYKSPPYHWDLKYGDHEFEIITRTIRYDHEAGQRLKGMNASMLWLLEATELPPNAFKFGISRLRGENADHHYVALLDCNPSTKSHWVYKTFIKDSKIIFQSDHWWITEKIISITIGNIVTNLKVIIFHTTTFANPHFPVMTLAAMKESMSEAEYQRLVLGQWNAKDGRVWEKYEVFKHPAGKEKEHAKKYDKIIIGIDPAMKSPTAITFHGYSDGIWEVFDEFREANRSIGHCRKEIIKRLQTWGITGNPQTFIDPAGLAWANEFNLLTEEQEGHNYALYVYQAMHQGTDPVLNRATKLGEMLRTKRLLISSLCTGVIADIEQTAFKTDSNKDEIDKQSYDPHSMDSVGYAQSMMWR